MNYKRKNKLFTALLAVVAALVFMPVGVNAQGSTGIGVSPAMIENNALTRGSTFEQEFVFSRGTPEGSAEAVIEVEGDVRDWVVFGNNNKVVMPNGQQRVTTVATVKVPANAEYKNYEGSATVKLVKRDDEGQVRLEPAVKLGINISVTDQTVAKLMVRLSEISNFPKNFPLTLNLKIENQGNVADSPESILLNVSDINGNPVKTLETTDIKKVNPFKTETVAVKFENVGLNEGTYFAKLSVFDQNNNIHENDLSFEVTGEQAIEDDKDENKYGSRTFGEDKATTIAVIAIGLAIVALPLLLFLITKRKKKSETAMTASRITTPTTSRAAASTTDTTGKGPSTPAM